MLELNSLLIPLLIIKYSGDLDNVLVINFQHHFLLRMDEYYFNMRNKNMANIVIKDLVHY